MSRRIYVVALLLLISGALSRSFAQTGSKAETAMNLMMEGDYPPAKKAAEEALSTDKNNALALVVRGNVALYDNNLPAAKADFDKAVKLSPDNGVFQASLAEYYRIENKTPAMAQKIAEKAIGLLRTPKTATEFFYRGVACYILEKRNEAMADYTKTIGLNPRYVRAYAKRAALYNYNQQPDLAIADFNKAIEINPRYSVTYFYLGTAYLNQQQYDLAIAALTKAVQFEPNSADAWFNRGVAYKQAGKYEQALADYTKVIQLTPKDYEAYSNRGNVYFMQEQYDKAITEYNKTIELNPNFAKAYSLRGNAYARKKQPELAEKDQNKAIVLDPKYADAYMERGHLYYNNKLYDQALKDYNKVIELSPKFSNGYLYAGFVHHDKQRFNEAITNYNKAIELDPKNMYAYVNRADAYDAIGNSKQAIVDRKKYADLGGKLSATGGNATKSLFPASSFDPTMAKAGLERGTSIIRGRACSKFDGLRFDASGVKVLLYPVTPYLEEWYELREKKESKNTFVYMSTEANEYHIEATADADGRFSFEGLKPGRYFIQIIHHFNQLKTAKVYTGSDTYMNGPVRTTTNYYYNQDYTVERSKRFEKFVEIKEDGDTKKITLTSGLIKSCAF